MVKKNPAKRLGSQFEREISRLLSAWILGKDITNSDEVKNTKIIVWRVGSSGAVSTINKQENMHGDIVAVDEIAVPVLEKFNFEVKRRKNFNLFSVLSNKNKKQELFSWFNQAKIDKYYPVLILKIMYVGWYAIIDTKTLFDLIDYCGQCPNYIKLKFDDRNLFIFDLIDFLQWIYNYVKMLQDLFRRRKNA